MEYKKNLIPGVVLAGFSTAYLIGSCWIKPFTGLGATPLDNRFVPRLWGGMLLLLSLILIWRGVKQRKEEIEKNGGKVSAGKNLLELCKENFEVIASFAALAVYTALMEPVGFLISTALYLYGEILILSRPEKRNYVLPAIVAVMVAVVVDLVFVRFLSVMLPTGIFGF